MSAARQRVPAEASPRRKSLSPSLSQGRLRPSQSTVMEPTASFRSASPEACRSVNMPPEVMQISHLTAGERVRQEWSLRRASSARSSLSSPMSIGSCRSTTPKAGQADTPLQRREAMQDAKHDALVKKFSPKTPDLLHTPRTSNPLSLWAKTKEARYSYQYGNFEGKYPQFVPTPSLSSRAPALMVYEKSSSFVVV